MDQVNKTFLEDCGVRLVNVVVLGVRLGRTRLFVLCVSDPDTPVVVFVVGVVCSVGAKYGRFTLGALVYEKGLELLRTSISILPRVIHKTSHTLFDAACVNDFIEIVFI